MMKPLLKTNRCFMLLCLCVGFAFMPACSNPKVQPPIAYHKMKAIMIDVQLAEAYALYVTGKDSSTDKGALINGRNRDTLVHYYEALLKHHDVSAAQFFSAIDWYLQHPGDLDSVYAKTMAGMSELESQMVVPEAAPKP